MNFRNKLLLYTLPPVFILMSLMAYIILSNSSDSLVEAQVASMEQTVTQIKAEVESWITDRENEVSILSQDHSVIANLKEGTRSAEVQSKLSALHEVGNSYSSVVIIGTDGVIRMNSVKGRSIGMQLKGKRGFGEVIQAALSGQTTVGRPTLNPATKAPVITLASPIKSDGTIIGAVIGVADMIILTDKFISPVKFGASGYPYIIDEKGLIMAYPKKDSLLKLNLSQYNFGKKMLQQREGKLLYNFKNVDKIAILKHSEKLNWIIAASGTIEEFYSSINSLKYLAATIAIISSLILAVVIFFSTQKVFVTVRRVSKGVTSGADEILMASGQLTESSNTLSTSATQQASSIEETSASLEELTSMVANNLSGAHATNKLADEMHEISLTADEHIAELTESMGKLKTSNEDVKHLVDIINKISEKAAVIDEIVFQTKLLSFNASVEAERAGEHGRGFAVVAQEVGNLAQMSGKAAQEISEILVESIRNAERITTANETNVIEGTSKVVLIDEVIKKVLTASKEVASNANGITQASEEQHLGLKQITEAVTTLDQSIQDTSSVASESAAASEELRGQASSLTVLIESLSELVGEAREKGKLLSRSKPKTQSKPKKIESKKVTEDGDDDTWNTL